ncbi:MAG: cytochrome c [Gemmatimonadota bacterium]|nr:cytochrome c [Gemmatimonadota bacterium]
MTRRTLSLTLTLVVATAASAYAFGGWAVITVDELPDTLSLGAPTQFSFKIRQHGLELMHDLKPSVEARMGSLLNPTVVRADAIPGKTKGQYTASLVVPKAGEWKVTIKSGFGPSDLPLLPMQATDGKSTIATISDGERGKRLFVAKGCITCHANATIDQKGPMQDVGPNLTGKTYDATYLAMWLENPKIRPRTNPNAEMPDLGLSKKEVAALTAFINGTTAATAKQK